MLFLKCQVGFHDGKHGSVPPEKHGIGGWLDAAAAEASGGVVAAAVASDGVVAVARGSCSADSSSCSAGSSIIVCAPSRVQIDAGLDCSAPAVYLSDYLLTAMPAVFDSSRAMCGARDTSAAALDTGGRAELLWDYGVVPEEWR